MVSGPTDENLYEQLKGHRDLRMRVWISLVSLVLAVLVVGGVVVLARVSVISLVVVVVVLAVAAIRWWRSDRARRPVVEQVRPGAARAVVSRDASSLDDLEMLGYDDRLPKSFTVTLSNEGLELWHASHPLLQVPLAQIDGVAPDFGRIDAGVKSYAAPQVVVVVRPTDEQVAEDVDDEKMTDDELIAMGWSPEAIKAHREDAASQEPYDFESDYGRGTIALGLALWGPARMWPASNAYAWTVLQQFARFRPLIRSTVRSVSP